MYTVKIAKMHYVHSRFFAQFTISFLWIAFVKRNKMPYTYKGWQSLRCNHEEKFGIKSSTMIKLDAYSKQDIVIKYKSQLFCDIIKRKTPVAKVVETTVKLRNSHTMTMSKVHENSLLFAVLIFATQFEVQESYNTVSTNKNECVEKWKILIIHSSVFY